MFTTDAVQSPNEGPGSAAGRAGCGGATAEPDVHQKVSAAADAVPSPNEGPGSAAGRAGCGGATPEPDFNNNPNSISRLRSLLPSARRRLDELPGPSHCEGAS